MASPTTSKGMVYPAHGGQVDSWDNAGPAGINQNWENLDLALASRTDINVVGASGAITLTYAQYLRPLIVFSGAQTANLTYNFPAGISWNGTIANSTTGAFTLTIGSATGGGASVVVPQGTITSVLCDGGTVIFGETRPASAAGADTYIQYNAGGVLGAETALRYDYSSNTLTITSGSLSMATSGGIAIANGSLIITTGSISVGTGGLTISAGATSLTPASGVALTVHAASGTHSTQIADTANTLKKAGYLNIPYAGGAVKTTSYTAVLADAGGTIGLNGSSLTGTIPANSSVAYDLMTTLTFVNLNATNASIACGDTMTLAGTTTTGTRTLKQNGVATAIKTGATSWIISGPGLT